MSLPKQQQKAWIALLRKGTFPETALKEQPHPLIPHHLSELTPQWIPLTLLADHPPPYTPSYPRKISSTHGDAYMATRKISPYSSAHNVYFRLDLFLVDKFTLQQVFSAVIGLITWSDHAPISLELSISTNTTTPSSRRLNSSLLNKPEYQKQIDSALENFFTTNSSSVSDPAILSNKSQSLH